MTPLAFYLWLRRVHGYRPRTAAASTLAHFCHSAAEKNRRLARWRGLCLGVHHA